MSLTKLLKMPMNLFKKDSISFLIIRRHDVGVCNENLSYIAVRPHSSLATLRYKLWELLQLPDFCDEVIVLRTYDGLKIPLTALKKGNQDPRNPFILEVWLPQQIQALDSVTNTSNMLTMGEQEDKKQSTEISIPEFKQLQQGDYERNAIEYDPRQLKRHTIDNKRTMLNLLQSDYQASELSGKLSHSSLFFKVHARKSKDNLTHMLMKIQSDLSTLSHKIGTLESKFQN